MMEVSCGAPANPLVFLDIRVGDEQVGRVVIELFQNLFPNTCANFIALCTGQSGTGSSGKPLHYKGCRIHKVIARFLIQGGDVEKNDGTGSDSIFGKYFPNEGPWLKHDQPGLLGMANSGPNSNGSQFYITTVNVAHHLDGRHTLFGRVFRGMGVVSQIEYTPTHEDNPIEDVIIEHCGIYEDGMPLGPIDPFGDDIFPPFPEDCPPNFIDFTSLSEVAHVAEKVKIVGNFYYKKEQFVRANAKYKKALRYLNRYQEESHELTPPEEAALTQAVIPNILNSAACKIKLKMYDQALEDCNEALDVVPNHPKALYRRGQAYHGKRDYERAVGDLTQALYQTPHDRSVVAELKACKGEMATYKEREKKACQKYFTGFKSANMAATNGAGSSMMD